MIDIDHISTLWNNATLLRVHGRGKHVFKLYDWYGVQAWSIQTTPYGAYLPWRLNIRVAEERILISGRKQYGSQSEWEISTTGSALALTEARLRGLI